MKQADLYQKVLITGATGFIGKRTVQYFLEKNYLVKALVRHTNQDCLVEHPNLEVISGNMQDYTSLRQATQEIQWVIHLAAAKSDEQDSYQTNVQGAENLLKACKESGVSYIINVSTQSAKIKKKGVYADTKFKADQLFINNPIPITTLRPSVVYGDKENGVFGSLVKASNLPFIPIFGSGEWRCRPIHVEDLIKTFELAFLHPEKHYRTYDIGGPDEISLNGLIDRITSILNKRPLIVHLPAWIGYAAAKMLSFIFTKPPITISNILGSTQNTEMDTQTYFRDFSFTPRCLDKGLQEIFASENIDYQEAQLLFAYLLSHQKVQFPSDDLIIQRYTISLKTHDLPPNTLDPLFYRYP